MIYPLIFFSIFFIWLSWNYQKWSLFLILALLPAYQIRFQVLGIPLTFLEVLILVLWAVWLIKQIRHQQYPAFRYKKMGTWFWLISLWLLISIIAVFISPDLRAGAGIWKAYFLEPILFLIVFLDVIKNKKDLRLAIGALICSGLLITFYTFYQKITGQGVWSTEIWGQPKILRTTGPFPHPNFLGLYLGPLFMLGLGYIFLNFKKNIPFLLKIIFFAVLFLGSLVFAKSEGAIIAIFIALFFYAMLYKPIRKWVLIFVLIFVLFVSFFSVPRHYLTEKIFFQDLSGRLRVNIWKGATEILKEKSILGVGLNGYQVLAPEYQERYYDKDTQELISVETHPYPHNLFLTIWLELGLLGLFIFFLILFQFFKKGFEVFKKEPILIGSIMGAMVVILIHGLVDTPYFKNDLAILFWVIIGLMIIISRRGTEAVITASPRKRLVP